MNNSPSIVRTEEDRAPILADREPSLKESALIASKSPSNEKQAVHKSKSGVQRGNERLAKEKALKKEFIPSHSLLPSGIKDIEAFKNIRANQKNQKTNVQPKIIKVGSEDTTIASVIITPDSKYAILGTSRSIIMFDIENSQVHCRLDEVHSGTVGYLALGGKDSKYLISTSKDGMKIFDWQAKLELLHTVQRNSGFKKVAGGEEYLAVVNSEKQVELYSLNELSSEPLHIFDEKAEEDMNGMGLHKNNKHLFICRDYSVEIFDTQTFESVYTFEDAHGGEYLYAFKLSADSELFVTAAQDMSIKVWNVAEREEIHSFDHVHSDLIDSVLLSSDKRFLVSWSVKGIIKVINLETGLTVHTIETGDDDHTMEADISPNAKFLVTIMDSEMKLWDFESGQYFLRDGTFNSQALHGESKVCPNSKFFVQWLADNQILHVCDMESGEIFDISGKIELYSDLHLEVSPNGEFIIGFQRYQESSIIYVYHHHKDLKTEIQVEDRITAMIISPDSRFLIYSNDIDIKFIEVATQAETQVFPDISEHQVENLWMSPNGNYIAVDTLDQSISLVDVRTEDTFIFRDIHENKITSLAFSFDSQYFVTASQDKSIKVFAIQSKQLVHQFSAVDDHPINDACWSPDNRYIATGNADIHLYDLQTKSHAMTIENPHKKEGTGITEIAISPNGKALFFNSTKAWKGSPEIYRLDPHISGSSSTMSTQLNPPSEQDLISYNYFKGHYSRFNSIEDSLLKSNRPKAEVFSKILESNLCLLPYSWNILHIAAIDGNDNLIKHMPKYEDFKISFLLDKYEKTPLHYMIAQDKITYSSVNIMLTYICDYLDDCAEKRKYEYQQIIKSLNPLCWFILLKCEIKLRERFLSLCFIDSPTPYKMELPIFGEPTKKSTYFAQSPEVTPEIKEIIWDEGQDQVWFKTNLLYLDYTVTSDDMGKTIECLVQQDSEDLFRTPLVQKLLKQLWNQSRWTLYGLLAIFSAFMLCLSVYIALHERILAFEIVIISIAGILLVGETLQMSTARMDYFTNPWNMLDLMQLLMTVAFIITRFTNDDNSLARSWMSTVIILAGYLRWVSYLRVFQPIRNFMEIFGTVLKDMFSFGVIIGLIIIGFSITFVAFGIGNESEIEFGPYGAYLYNAYNSLFGPVGNPDYGKYELSQNILIAVIAFLLNVILLNLLISIMGESMNNVLAMKDKTETLTKFEMIMEAVTFMKFFRKKAKGSNKNYLVYCFSLQSEESKAAPESEMELRIGKKFVDLKEDFAERLDNIEEYLEENKKLSAQLADFKEFYLRTRGLREFEGLKRKYKDIKRLEKKLEHLMENEDHDSEEESGDDDDGISSLDASRRNDIRVNKSFTGKVEPESVAVEKSNLEGQDNRI